MATPLPKELAYVAPAMVELEKFDPDSRGDDNPDALDIVQDAVRNRLRGVTDADDQRAIIERDAAQLEEWLNQPDLANSTGWYVQGCMLGLLMYRDPATLLE